MTNWAPDYTFEDEILSVQFRNATLDDSRDKAIKPKSLTGLSAQTKKKTSSRCHSRNAAANKQPIKEFSQRGQLNVSEEECDLELATKTLLRQSGIESSLQTDGFYSTRTTGQLSSHKKYLKNQKSFILLDENFFKLRSSEHPPEEVTKESPTESFEEASVENLNSSADSLKSSDNKANDTSEDADTSATGISYHLLKTFGKGQEMPRRQCVEQTFGPPGQKFCTPQQSFIFMRKAQGK